MFQEMMCGRGEDSELGGRRGSSRLGLQDIQLNVFEGHPSSLKESGLKIPWCGSPQRMWRCGNPQRMLEQKEWDGSLVRKEGDQGVRKEGDQGQNLENVNISMWGSRVAEGR